ncbi:MAG: restriction endonuclease subunit S [Bacteroidota bacterium]
MKRLKLKNIANIRFGLNAKTNDRSGILCLQGKDLKDNRLEIAGYMYAEPNDCTARDILQPGNVLFSAKGNRHMAAVWDKNDKAVASSTFLILSVNEQEVLPEYLAWYLNQPKTQNYLKQVKKGGTVSVVSKKEFEQIDVDIPSIEIQKKINRIVNLEIHEQQLMDELKAKRKLLVRGITNKIFQK